MIIIALIIFLFSVVIHEYAHAYIAYKCGDPTPVYTHRLSWNPKYHIDPWGVVALLIFGVGWAKPVQINPYYLKDPKTCIIKISLAGPFVNMLLALIGFFLVQSNIGFIASIGYITYTINMVLGLFNLLPFYPLDGFNALVHLLPARLGVKLESIKYVTFVLFLYLLFSGVINSLLNKVF